VASRSFPHNHNKKRFGGHQVLSQWFQDDNLVAIRLFFRDDCEMDDLAVAKLFF
jgi:hypothetical protein